jgi:hypothetical protein
MTQKYLLPMARNSITGQTVKTQDLTGARIRLDQPHIAQDLAEQLATKMTARTGDIWFALVREYVPTQRIV